MMNERQIAKIRGRFEQEAKDAAVLRLGIMKEREDALKSGTINSAAVMSFAIREIRQAAYEEAYTDAARSLACH